MLNGSILELIILLVFSFSASNQDLTSWFLQHHTMTLKITSSAFEHSLSIYESKIPFSLLKEIEKFKKRNCLIAGFNSKIAGIKSVCCEQCLKAHILAKVRDFGLDSPLNETINVLFKCETGHNSYYLDEGRLLRVWLIILSRSYKLLIIKSGLALIISGSVSQEAGPDTITDMQPIFLAREASIPISPT